MIKIYCDLCGEEQTKHDFTFEATKQEVITDLQTGQKRLDKTLIQICKDCYNKHIAKNLYEEKK
jgi:hypothetical protein